MILTEDIAKTELQRYGIRVPRGQMAKTGRAAGDAAADFGGSAVVKALIPSGGRERAGGVRRCSSVSECEEAADVLLGSKISDFVVQKVWIEEMLRLQNEMYAAVMVNSASGSLDLLFSLRGGIGVEESNHQTPQMTGRLRITPGEVLPLYRIADWLEIYWSRVSKNGFVPVSMPGALPCVLQSLYQAAVDCDALLLEVNPLALTNDRSLVALDCKLEVDDNALSRHPNWLPYVETTLTEREREAHRIGVSFVDLDGDVGVLASGAGMGLATADLLSWQGLRPANFLDTGGGISASLVQSSLELVMAPDRVRGAVINLYGGINNMIAAAEGIRAALATVGHERPIVVKIIGNQQEAAWALLDGLDNVHLVCVPKTEEAVREMARVLEV